MLKRSVIFRLMAPLAIFTVAVVALMATCFSTMADVASAHRSVEQAQLRAMNLTEIRSLSRSLQRDALNLITEPDAKE